MRVRFHVNISLLGLRRLVYFLCCFAAFVLGGLRLVVPLCILIMLLV